MSGVTGADAATADEEAEGCVEVPGLAHQRSQQQSRRHEPHAHLHHHPRPAAIHQSSEERAERGRHEEAEGKGSGRHTAIPAELVEDGREEQGKGGAGVDTHTHGDEGHRHHNPAVEEGERHRIKFTGGSPLTARWMFSAMTAARASIIPSVQPDTWGVKSTLGSSWNGRLLGRWGPGAVGYRYQTSSAAPMIVRSTRAR